MTSTFVAPTMRTAAALVLALSLAPLPAGAVDGGAEKSRIAAERSAAEASYAARERECRQRFIVSSCIEDARRERRAALDGLRARQIVIDEAARRERVAARRAELAAKAAEDARRDRERAARAATAASAASAPHDIRSRPLEPQQAAPRGAPAASAASGRSRSDPAGLGLKPRKVESGSVREAREARSRASFNTRQRQAAEHREEVVDRTATRMLQHPPAAPLPASAARPARPASRP
ncbi:MAG: hypothetical protein ABJA61_00755 [Caldimonas sp.]